MARKRDAIRSDKVKIEDLFDLVLDGCTCCSFACGGNEGSSCGGIQN